MHKLPAQVNNSLVRVTVSHLII